MPRWGKDLDPDTPDGGFGCCEPQGSIVVGAAREYEYRPVRGTYGWWVVIAHRDGSLHVVTSAMPSTLPGAIRRRQGLLPSVHGTLCSRTGASRRPRWGTGPR